jgi:hypothetical protein
MVAIALLVFANIEFAGDVMRPRTQSFLKYLIIIEISAAATATLITLNFQWTSTHSAFALIGMAAPISALQWIKRRDEAARMRLWAIFIFATSGLVFALKLSPHVWFNHVDVTHVIIAIAIYVFYRSALLMDQKDELQASLT